MFLSRLFFRNTEHPVQAPGVIGQADSVRSQPNRSLKSSDRSRKGALLHGDARRRLEILQQSYGIPSALHSLSSKPLPKQIEMATILLGGLGRETDERKRNETIQACKAILMRLADTSESISQEQYDRFISKLPPELKAGIADMDVIEREIDKRMAPILEQLMAAYDAGDKVQRSQLITKQRFMGAMLESLRRGCHTAGKALDADDPHIDRILVNAVHRAKAACREAREKKYEQYPHVAKFGFDRFKIEMVPHTHDTFATLKTIFAHTKPAIAAHNVWRAVIDPRQLAMLRDMGITQESFASGFLFDVDRSYLHKMSQGWKVAMHDPEQRLTPDFLIDLHAATAAGIPHPHASVEHEFNDENDYLAAGFYEKEHFYGTVESIERTPQGTKELKEFVERYKDYVRLEPDKEATAYFGSQAWKVVQLGTPKEKTAALIQKWIDDYYKKVKSAGTSDEKVLAAIELCQNLLRLHPFEDGNYRTFGILLLNRLLAAQGEGLAIFDEAHKLDGYSREELLKEVRKGQRLVLSWQ